VGDWVRGE
jgi:ATP-dependent RNA helicase DHX8/PRP22